MMEEQRQIFAPRSGPAHRREDPQTLSDTTNVQKTFDGTARSFMFVHLFPSVAHVPCYHPALMLQLPQQNSG